MEWFRSYSGLWIQIIFMTLNHNLQRSCLIKLLRRDWKDVNFPASPGHFISKLYNSSIKLLFGSWMNIFKHLQHPETRAWGSPTVMREMDFIQTGMDDAGAQWRRDAICFHYAAKAAQQTEVEEDHGMDFVDCVIFYNRGVRDIINKKIKKSAFCPNFQFSTGWESKSPAVGGWRLRPPLMRSLLFLGRHRKWQCAETDVFTGCRSGRSLSDLDAIEKRLKSPLSPSHLLKE